MKLGRYDITQQHGVQGTVIDGEFIPIIGGGKGGGGYTQTIGAPSPNMLSMQDLLSGLAGQQSGSLTQASALMNPQATLDQLNNKGAASKFDEQAYLAANPDVAAAVRAGKLQSGQQHYDTYGQSEGRNAPMKFGDARDMDSPAFRAQLQQAIQQQQDNNQYTNLVNQQAIERAKNPYGLSGAEQTGLDQQYGAAKNRFSNDLLTMMQANSGARGLRLSDSPVANEYVRQAGLGLGDLNSQYINTATNLGNNARQFGAGIQQFQAGLNNQYNFTNPLQFSAAAPSAGLGLYQGGLQQQLNQGKRSFDAGTPWTIGNITGAAQGIGSSANSLFGSSAGGTSAATGIGSKIGALFAA